MLKHLISLVFLLILLSYKPIYADSSMKILPEPKPKRILTFANEKKDYILPQKKPFFINKKKILEKNEILPKNKPEKKTNKITSKKIEKSIIKPFLLPEKKPITYKKIVQKEFKKSQVLSQRDYEIAKEVFALIKQKKMESCT